MSKQSGPRNAHCAYRSMGLLVMGDPVAIRRKVASRPTLVMDLVRLAEWFLIVVLSSTAMNALVARRKDLAKVVPFSVLNASMFMTRMRRSSTAAHMASICAFSALRGVGVQ